MLDTLLYYLCHHFPSLQCTVHAALLLSTDLANVHDARSVLAQMAGKLAALLAGRAQWIALCACYCNQRWRFPSRQDSVAGMMWCGIDGSKQVQAIRSTLLCPSRKQYLTPASYCTIVYMSVLSILQSVDQMSPRLACALCLFNEMCCSVSTGEAAGPCQSP